MRLFNSVRWYACFLSRVYTFLFLFLNTVKSPSCRHNPSVWLNGNTYALLSTNKKRKVIVDSTGEAHINASFNNIIISKTGYTGSGGYELYVENDHVLHLYKLILDSGKDYGIKPIGLAARDTLRLEMGYCLYGNDINDNTNPIEAGLKWVTKTNKDFIGKKFILETISNGTNKNLIGFELIERGIPRKGYKIFDSHNNEIGIVTSGTMSPILKKGIGMGYVLSSHSKFETEVYIEIRNKKIKSKIVKRPFIKLNE